ncbi:hypothetical protein A1O3_05520 [Capronia epimyces CBS 606.96]|uniref:Uncharacterized protein n=1 Tax=Capronia epimyces CBS 606.96 TaxID=1182542 RepID=W9Y6L3_9EURO|nr:uncharacterized protein A1O3_05520 [Capronia epimyces CBS 606.96]EXJ84846.1 hypothetical protein A1O3_05520 [Capronia epimyces CBS 606.96]
MPATTRSQAKQTHLETLQTTGPNATLPPHDEPSTRRVKSNVKPTRSKPAASETKAKASNPQSYSTSSSPAAKKQKRKRKLKQAREQEQNPDQEQSQNQPSGHLPKSRDVALSDPDRPAEAKVADQYKPIIINRAPVLQLWAACVAQRLHPDLSWPTCLAIGSAISTLCAISKGRAIGTIEPADPADGEAKKRKEAQKARAHDKAGADREVEIEVMGFRLLVDVANETVLVQGKPRHGSEGPLQAKFGGDHDYTRVKDAMDHAVATWAGGDGDEDAKELNKTAFHMYEAFRPSVQSGQRGWGRKGELSIAKIKEAVERERE